MMLDTNVKAYYTHEANTLPMIDHIIIGYGKTNTHLLIGGEEKE